MASASLNRLPTTEATKVAQKPRRPTHPQHLEKNTKITRSLKSQVPRHRGSSAAAECAPGGSVSSEAWLEGHLRAFMPSGFAEEKPSPREPEPQDAQAISRAPMAMFLVDSKHLFTFKVRQPFESRMSLLIETPQKMERIRHPVTENFMNAREHGSREGLFSSAVIRPADWIFCQEKAATLWWSKHFPLNIQALPIEHPKETLVLVLSYSDSGALPLVLSLQGTSVGWVPSQRIQIMTVLQYIPTDCALEKVAEACIRHVSACFSFGTLRRHSEYSKSVPSQAQVQGLQ